MTDATVLACPECGRKVSGTCYHDGEDVRAREMPAPEARRLRLAERERLLEAADAILEPGDVTDDPEPEPEDAP